MNEIPRAYNRLDTFLKAVLLFGFFVFIYCTLLLHDARAEDRLLLLYSGNVNGEIEGCGWHANQLGGLSKKAYQVKIVREQQDEPLLVLDAGNLLFKRTTLPQGESQEKITAAGIIEAYEKMGYDAVAVGPLDLAAGVDFLKKQTRSRLSWISANLLNADDSPIFLPFIIKKTGQSKTGIIGLTRSDSLPVNLHTGDWRTILPAQLQILSKKCDHIILLSNLSKNDIDEIAQRYPDILIIISADPQSSNLNPIVSNNTLITQTVQQGKYLGKLDIAWGNSGKWESGFDKQRENKAEGTLPSTFISRIIALQSSLPESDDIEKVIAGIKQQISRVNTSSQQANIVSNESTAQKTAPPGTLFAGFEQCRTCHPVQTDFWKSTQHAGSYTTLVNAGQANNLECLPCHVTHETHPSRKAPADMAELLSLPSSMQAVGCEICHGAGRSHAENPQVIKPIRRAEKNICLNCHTKERDADFNYEKKIILIQCPTN